MTIRLTCISLAALAAFGLSAEAQSAQDRAAALKQWKADCSQKDPDLRLAYIEDAIANQGATVARICARLALESDDPDTRALGLRAALAMTETLILPIEMPAEYQSQMEAAEMDDAEAVEKVNQDWRNEVAIAKLYGNAFALNQKKVSVDQATTEWTPKDRYGKFDKDDELIATSTADSVRFSGRISGQPVSIELSLNAGGVLVGTAMYEKYGPYRVAVELL